MFRWLREDVQAVMAKDPAAKSFLEGLLCYPGMHALWMHRINHWLWNHRLRLLARFLAHIVRRRTGVEIHPGARIGRRVVIDHGMGIVIGETAEVGDDVLIYQGVTLGGLSFEDKKRHPTIGDRVVIGAHAILLGPIQVGDGAKIGAGTVLRQDIAPESVILAAPYVFRRLGKEVISTADNGAGS
jgi:serine O-acetyltransferase